MKTFFLQTHYLSHSAQFVYELQPVLVFVFRLCCYSKWFSGLGKLKLTLIKDPDRNTRENHKPYFTNSFCMDVFFNLNWISGKFVFEIY